MMVFLIQNTQNRDSEAVHVKLDELLRSTRGAHLALLDLEELEQRDLDRIREQYGDLAKQARLALRRGKPDTGTAPVGAARRRRHGRSGRTGGGSAGVEAAGPA